jgi:hypothetical protein
MDIQRTVEKCNILNGSTAMARHCSSNQPAFAFSDGGLTDLDLEDYHGA